MKAFSVFLASASPRRREILKKIGISFSLVKSSYHEKFIPGLSPQELVTRHAVGKAQKAKIRTKQGLVLGADTLVFLNKRPLGKPKTLKAAFKMLGSLSGRAHFVYTGIALKNLESGKILTGFSKSKVRMKKLSKEKIGKYFQKVNPLDKAGAYAVQEGPRIVAKVTGSRTNVIGLPVELLKKMLKNF